MHAQAELWNHVFAYTRSMSLRCAVELGIPDAVHRLGSAATLTELAAALSLPPSRAPYLRRLMRLLTHTGLFVFDDAAASYGLTPLSRLLVSAPGVGGQGLSPFALAMLHPIVVSPSMSLASWFGAADARTAAARVPFEAAHGRDLWAVAKGDREFGAAFNNGMVCDGRFVMEKGVRREEGWWPELELRRRVPPPRREAAGEGAPPRAGEMGESRGGSARGWEMGERG